MQKIDYIVCGDYVLTMNKNLDVVNNGAVAVNNKKIVAVGKIEDILKGYQSEKIFEGTNRVVLPGLINTHTHAAMVYFRGLADDLPLTEWLQNYIWPAENKWLSPIFISDATELASLEMLKAGITTYNDMYFWGDCAALSAKKLGIRAVLGIGILDFPTASAKTTGEYFENAERFINNWKSDELIVPSLAPHAVYTCSHKTLKRAKSLSEALNVNLHIHISETEWEVQEILKQYGKRPVEHLEDIGFLDKNVLLAHCVYLDDNEIELLSKNKVGVSHCLESNLKLASGFAPIIKMLNAGIKVTFGTDSAASNNDLNILSEMTTSAKLHKALSKVASQLNAKEVLLMATRWGADVLGLGQEIGSLEKGKLGDIITMNLLKPHLVPIYNIYSHIVYSARASDVETVLVNGNLIVDKGKIVIVEEEEILYKAINWGKQIQEAK